MSKLEICLFGGFEARFDGRPVQGFESQKVRALLAYLATGRPRAYSRELLAGLLWPEEDEEAARRNLRQALYNLKRSVAREVGRDFELLDTSQQKVSIASSAAIWLDVEAFEEHLRASRSEEDNRPDAARLAAAVRLYEGDFLAGFYVHDSLDFEEWLIAEQERLREAALEALRMLVEHHMATGTYALGVEYARRWLRIDPLSELAHRQLMRLYAFSGRRSKALAQYEQLCRLLREELEVEPLEETTADYQAIVAEELPGPAVTGQADPVGPWVPLAGRHDAAERLRAAWAEVIGGRGRLTLVSGEKGVGKTRLVKSVIHEATHETSAIVLQGRCYVLDPPTCYGAFAEALRNAVAHEVEVAERLLAGSPVAQLAQLARLVPEVRVLKSDLERSVPQPEGGREALFESVAGSLELLTEASEEGVPPEPVILFLDDLHWADPSSIELLAELARRLAGRPIWLLATVLDADEGALGEKLRPLVAEEIRLERLGGEAVQEIAASLVGDAQAGKLAELLERASGLPLAITELINFLWDRRILVEHYEGHWTLEIPDWLPLPETLEEIIRARLSGLPTSTRRLLTLAAVAGHAFDADLLQEAEVEHETVVEVGIRVLLERWMGRLLLGYWADSRRERDIALWASGPQRGTFEFSHPHIREVLYHTLEPSRRQLLHRRVAEVLERRLGPDDRRGWEILAHHFYEAQEWDRALVYLEGAGDKARALSAPETARHYYERALSAHEALGDTGGTAEMRRRSAARERLACRLEEIVPGRLKAPDLVDASG